MSQTREPPPRRILRQNKNHLPHDIVLNILARLPVKSVLRFRCVSKNWYSSIATPNFISNHLIYHKNNNNDNDNLAYFIKIPPTIASPLNNNIPIFIGGYDHAFNRISEYPIPFAFLVSYALSAGSCNGLVCLYQFRDDPTNVDSIYLWNPSIRKVKRLPDSIYSFTHFHRVSTELAYQSETNDYKVVNIYQMLAPNHRGFEVEAEVYTLSSNSWRKIGISLTNNIVVSPFTNKTSTFVSGALHWLGYISEAAFPYVILSFDVNNDKFGEIAFPDVQQLLPQGLMAIPNSLMVFKGKLAFITLGYLHISGVINYEYRDFVSSHRNSCFIWVMREYGVHESWSKLFFVKFENVNYVHFLGCTSHGELLVIKNGVYPKSNAEQRRKVIVSLDLETLHEKDLGFQNAPHIANSFMESLVLLDGTTELSG
ncbi:F-box/kelch-repeat protein At3g23880-like [Quercus lobata]|uniref:F-box domain-containing protein n=1 Tax=Quercus lobata TaxID=97700 RepID=A0A7N2LIR1_QUELO|nr:F-box/kelch-repeat protein At3g23880-like [Quercus lobata]